MQRYQLITIVSGDLMRFCVGETIAYLESIAERFHLSYYVIEPV